MQTETLRRVAALLTVGLVVVTAYVGWVFLGRHMREKNREEAAREKTQETYSAYANEDFEELRILHFYVSPPRIQSGQDALLCYGVQGASSVEILNVDEAPRPSRNRCFKINPTANTTYTLTAKGTRPSSKKTATLVLNVDPPA